MYYLNSRYYNPEIGRFINADGQLNEGILGKNMYSYTVNNPIMYVDISGNSSWSFIDQKLNNFDTLLVIDYCSNFISMFEEHTKGARKSTKGKHQKGQTRRIKDNFGEKGDLRRNPNPNKRSNHFEINNYIGYPSTIKLTNYDVNNVTILDVQVSTSNWFQDNWEYIAGGAIVVGGVVLLVWVVGNDVSGIGLADDGSIPWIIGLITGGAKVFAS